MKLFARTAPKTEATTKLALDAREVSFFFENGFVVIPKLFSDEEVAAINTAVDRAWADRSISTIT